MRRVLVAPVVAALLLLTGCTGAAPQPDGTVTVTSTPSTTASSGAASATASSSPAPSSPVPSSSATTARTDPNAPENQCADDALAVTIRTDVEGNGLSHRGFFVVLQNTGGTRCELRGIPGVSIVGHGNGTQLGAPAERLGTSDDPTVELAPEGYAVAVLDTEQMDEHGGIFADGHGGDPRCRVAKADGYRIYPPHSFRAVFVRRDGLYACTTGVHWQTIGEVQPGDRVAGFDS